MENLLHHATELLLLLFLVITFLQSGIDKLLDWNGNLTWLTSHFAATPLKQVVPFLLAAIMVVELCTAILCFLGLFQLLITGEGTLARYGAILSCIALLMLLSGQRVARDYEGAKTIAVYFIPAIFLVYVLSL